MWRIGWKKRRWLHFRTTKTDIEKGQRRSSSKLSFFTGVKLKRHLALWCSIDSFQIFLGCGWDRPASVMHTRRSVHDLNCGWSRASRGFIMGKISVGSFNEKTLSSSSSWSTDTCPWSNGDLLVRRGRRSDDVATDARVTCCFRSWIRELWNAILA